MKATGIALPELTGDDSWSSDKMRKYFQRVEHCQYSSRTWDLLTGGQHGFDGWLSTERPRSRHVGRVCQERPRSSRDILAAVALTDIGRSPGSITDAFIHRAIPKLFSAALKKDINHMDSVKHRPEGLYLTPVATNGGKRASVRDRIREVQKVCPNQLVVKTNVLVTKILLEKVGGPSKASSSKPSEWSAVKARISIERTPTPRFMIPCRQPSNCGPRKKSSSRPERLTRPQLLMLSGIGPKEELERHGIPVNIALPGVGKNLQDRYEVGIVYKLKENLSTLEQGEV